MGLLPLWLITIFISLLRIVKVLAPICVKLLLIAYFRESIEVKMPTNAMIPKAMIKMVRMVLSRWLLMEVSDTLMFSAINIFKRNENSYFAKVIKQIILKARYLKLYRREKVHGNNAIRGLIPLVLIL